MGAKDPFGFVAAAEGVELDLTVFDPKPKAVDRASADAASEVAQDAGFTRRRSAKSAPKSVAPAKADPATEKGRKRRVNITELLGIKDRYPETERAQLNMLAPVPVALRWRQLVKDASLPAWEVLERAMEALEAESGAGAARRGS
jgi:hypothetical protein